MLRFVSLSMIGVLLGLARVESPGMEEKQQQGCRTPRSFSASVSLAGDWFFFVEEDNRARFSWQFEEDTLLRRTARQRRRPRRRRHGLGTSAARPGQFVFFGRPRPHGHRASGL